MSHKIPSKTFAAVGKKLRAAEAKRTCRICSGLKPDGFAPFWDPIHLSCHARAMKDLEKFMKGPRLKVAK